MRISFPGTEARTVVNIVTISTVSTSRAGDRRRPLPDHPRSPGDYGGEISRCRADHLGCISAAQFLVRAGQVLRGERRHQRHLPRQHRGPEDLRQAQRGSSGLRRIRPDPQHLEGLPLRVQLCSATDASDRHGRHVDRGVDGLGAERLDAGDPERAFHDVRRVLSRRDEERGKQVGVVRVEAHGARGDRAEKVLPILNLDERACRRLEDSAQHGGLEDDFREDPLAPSFVEVDRRRLLVDAVVAR